MGNFEYNSMEELVFSRSFRNWVLDKDSPEADFWENWITRHPERREMVHYAKAVIYALQLHLKKLSDEEIDTEVGNALQRLKDAAREIPGTPREIPGTPRELPGAFREFADENPWADKRRFSLFRGPGRRRLPGATPFSGRYARP